MATQLQALKSFFKRRKTITQAQAMADLGIMRLSERIRELEAAGWEFLHKREPVRSRYGATSVIKYQLIAGE